MGLENLRCPGLEQTLAVFPEILPCPEGGNEIKIRADERKGRCSICNKMVDPMQPEHAEKPSKNNKFQVTIKEHEDVSGTTLYYERYEAIIPISSFDHAKNTRSRVKPAIHSVRIFRVRHTVHTFLSF